MLSRSVGLTLLEGKPGSKSRLEGTPRLEYCQIRRSAILSGFRLPLICSHGKRDCANVISPIGVTCKTARKQSLRKSMLVHHTGYVKRRLSMEAVTFFHGVMEESVG